MPTQLLVMTPNTIYDLQTAFDTALVEDVRYQIQAKGTGTIYLKDATATPTDMNGFGWHTISTNPTETANDQAVIRFKSGESVYAWSKDQNWLVCSEDV